MSKLVLSAIAAAALAGSAYTLAATAATDAPEAPAPHWMAGPGTHPMREPGVVFDAKLAGMKAELNLSPDQEKLWPAFELAVRDGHKARMERMRDWREQRDGAERPSPIAIMTEMSNHLAQASDSLKKIADSAKPLYDSLDDGQKRHFGPLLLMLRGDGSHPGGGRGEPGSHGPKPL